MKTFLSLLCVLSALMLCPADLRAWDGYDYDTGSYIEMEHPAKPGADVEIYDYDDETWHDVTVISINNHGTDMEVFDFDTGDYRTFEMEPAAINRGT